MKIECKTRPELRYTDKLRCVNEALGIIAQDEELWNMYREAIRLEDELMLDSLMQLLEERYGVKFDLDP